MYIFLKANICVYTYFKGYKWIYTIYLCGNVCVYILTFINIIYIVFIYTPLQKCVCKTKYIIFVVINKFF